MEKKRAAIFLLLALAFAARPSGAGAEHNITSILARFPEYSAYNSYLSQTKVADEINSRETLTCLVLANPAMSALAAKHPLAALKNALRLLTLLDYYDPKKLHTISDGSVLTTTLLQTTGAFQGNLGFVNITDLRGGKVGFCSTSPGSRFDSTYTRSVQQLPYSISVLEVSAPVLFPTLLDVPARSNISTLLNRAGCKTFASLLASSGVLAVFQSAMDKGLTIFAPNDEAFKADGAPDVHALTQSDLVSLLEYHAIPEYAPKATLAIAKGRRITTLATSAARRFDLSAVASGDDVRLRTALDDSRVASTVLDDPPACILTVDNLLLPIELFGKAPSPAPAPAPEGASPAPAPAPSSEPPAPASVPSAPAPANSSRHATPPGSPELSPADAPDEDAADMKNDQAAGTRRGGGAAVAGGLLAVLLTSLL